MGQACVETADCDKNITCGEGVCFRKFCKPACEANDDCGQGELCVACNNNCLNASPEQRVCVRSDNSCEPICDSDSEECCLGACVAKGFNCSLN